MNLSSLVCTRVGIGLLVAVTVSLLTTTSEAKVTHISDGYPSIGQGIRPLGMGNAFLTMPGTDENALFYNPAALEDFERAWQYTVFSPGVTFNKRLITTIKDVFDLSKDLKNAGSDSAKINTFQAFFDKHVGEFQTVRLRLPLLLMIRKGWAGGVLVDTGTTVSLRNVAFPNFEIRSRNDGIGVLAKSLRLMEGLDVGVLVKGVYRLQLDRIVTTNDILGNSLNQLIGFNQWGRAFGGGGDLGVRYKLPLPGLNPAVAVTYQNIGKTRFKGSSVDDIPQSLNAGAGIHPRLGNFGLSVEAAITELTERRDFLTRVHAGAELRFPWLGPMRLSLRGGTNQGYPAGGFSLDFKHVRWDNAFYGEEIGERTRQGRTYKFATEFAFVI